MKFDVNVMRHLGRDDFRTLQAVEIGQKNHEIVPVPLIDAIAGLRRGSAVRCLKTLLRSKLLHHDGTSYDGYRLTTLGFDYLALRALVLGGHVSAVGRRLGVGKESDVYEVLLGENGGKGGSGGRGGGRRDRRRRDGGGDGREDESGGDGGAGDLESPGGRVAALKLHRLGRTSFRAVASKRDYLGKRTQYSWLSLSRLAAAREHAFMRALFDAGFPVPEPYAVSRHAVLMELVPGVALSTVSRGQGLRDPGRAYKSAVSLAESLASRGLVHCDLNEFNLIVGMPTQREHERRERAREERRRRRDGRGGDGGGGGGGGGASPSSDESDSGSDSESLTLIDFPQMVSTDHANARALFERDAACLVKFFASKLGYHPDEDDGWVTSRRREGKGSRADFDAALARGRGERPVAAEEGAEAEGGGDEGEEEEGRDGVDLSSGGNLGVATRASGFKKRGPGKRGGRRADDGDEDDLDRFLDGRGRGGGEEGGSSEDDDDDESDADDDDESDADDESDEGGRSGTETDDDEETSLSEKVSGVALAPPETPAPKEKKNRAEEADEEGEEDEDLAPPPPPPSSAEDSVLRAAAVKARVAAEARAAAARRLASQASKGARKATSRDKRRATAGAGKGF